MRSLLRITLAFALLVTAIPLPAQTRPDGQHDFDFEFGRWRVHLVRLLRPLTQSSTWATLEGTSIVRPVWGGRANLGELEVNGEGTRIEGLSLRVYDPQTRQWRIHWASSRDGVVGPAMVGGFTNDRGEFYGHEEFEGRPIVVRFIFSGITATAFKIEQAFSDDGGKTWETNWITSFTKVEDEASGAERPSARDRFVRRAPQWTDPDTRPGSSRYAAGTPWRNGSGRRIRIAD